MQNLMLFKRLATITNPIRQFSRSRNTRPIENTKCEKQLDSITMTFIVVPIGLSIGFFGAVLGMKYLS